MGGCRSGRRTGWGLRAKRDVPRRGHPVKRGVDGGDGVARRENMCRFNPCCCCDAKLLTRCTTI